MNTLQFALNQVNQAFPGVFNIPMPDAAKFLGIAPKTARNQLTEGRAPFPTVLRGGQRYVPAPALAAVIAADLEAAGIAVDAFAQPQGEQTPASQPKAPADAEKSTGAPAAVVKRGRGRPRKIQCGVAR